MLSLINNSFVVHWSLWSTLLFFYVLYNGNLVTEQEYNHPHWSYKPLWEFQQLPSVVVPFMQIFHISNKVITSLQYFGTADCLSHPLMKAPSGEHSTNSKNPWYGFKQSVMLRDILLMHYWYHLQLRLASLPIIKYNST